MGTRRDVPKLSARSFVAYWLELLTRRAVWHALFSDTDMTAVALRPELYTLAYRSLRTGLSPETKRLWDIACEVTRVLMCGIVRALLGNSRMCAVPFRQCPRTYVPRC